jgi:5'-nucleotidase
MVLSGINHGSNLGTDVLYSGTVSAAMEGAIEGIPSIAFSLTSFAAQDFQPAANFAKTLVQQFGKNPLPEAVLLNVNVPAVPQEAIAGVMMTRQGLRRYVDQFEQRTDPRGKTYYWLAGELVQDVPQPSVELLVTTAQGSRILDSAWLNSLPTDVQAIRGNHITITPLQFNLTCASGLAHLRDWQLEL